MMLQLNANNYRFHIGELRISERKKKDKDKQHEDILCHNPVSLLDVNTRQLFTFLIFYMLLDRFHDIFISS